METSLQNRGENYRNFIEECRAILVEAEFTARWTMLEAYHLLGQKIALSGATPLRVAKDLGKSERTIQYAVRFALKYPAIEDLPGGKSISWRKVIKLITTPGKEIPEEHCRYCPIHCPCGKNEAINGHQTSD